MRFKISLIIGLLIGQLGGLLLPFAAHAAGGSVIISGLQTGSLTQTSDEFVELLNPTVAPISISGWQMQYRASSSTNGTDCTKGWTTKATIAAGSISSGGRYLLSSAGYLNGDATFASGLSSTAGTVRIIDSTKSTVDALAWGAATCGTGTPAPAPAAGQNLVRRDGLDGAHADNKLDFLTQVISSISTTSSAPSPTPAPEAAVGSGAASSSKLMLTELLVDPVAPLSDAADEFIEIYNSGTVPIEGEGYIIQSGTHKFGLPKGMIAPGEYLVITSAGSTLSFSNSGGVANLMDPAGDIIDTVGTWGPAVPGSSWAFTDDTWRWTTTPTPGAANIYTGTAALDEGADYAAVELSELLPDPAAPLTDANDEYIEIYNPTDQPVDLTGYVLKAGHDLASKYAISGVSVQPDGYATLKSSVSKLALSNSGSSVALYAPNGVQLGATVTYPKAASGNAWARLNGTWDWTSEPSPGTDNVIAAIAALPAATKAKAAAKVAAPKAKAATKPKAVKAAKAAKTAKAKKTATKPLLAGTTSKGGRWLLYILAGLTLAYIIYEFRHDIRNYYYKLRGYPIGRPATVPITIGRGSDRAGQRPGRG